MAETTIGNLTLGAVDGTSLFEQERTVNGSQVSEKVLSSSIANFVGTSHQFAGLETDAKDIIGAINEANQSGGGASVIQLTQAEYTALLPAEKMNGSIYKLTDKAIFYCLDEEYHAVKELTTAQYEALTTAQQNNGTIYIQTDAETTGEDIAVSDSDTTSIAATLGVTTGTITTNSGFNIRGTPIVKKVNKVVQVQFNINADTEFNSRQTIGKVSEGFRPSATIAFSVMGSSAVNYFANRMTSLLITASGDLIVGDLVVPSGVNIKEVVASVSFIVD